MAFETIIELKNVDIFQRNNLILSDVNFKINKSEFVYLIGKTGSGKSSILKTIYADLPVKNGEVYVSNFAIHSIKSKEIPMLRRKIGIVFQDFQLLSDRSVIDNLIFVMKATGWTDKIKMKDRSNEVLTKVGLATKGFKFPHQLSGGEQQRVAIARALINYPDLILADEPTGNLDPDTSEGIIQLLFDICASDRAILMATHNYTLMNKYPSRKIKCENGKIKDISENQTIEQVNIFDI